MPNLQQEPTARIAAEIIKRWFANQNGELAIGGIAVSKLAHSFGTPFFAYDEAVLQGRLSLLENTFGPAFDIYYSMKANPDPRVTGFFAGNCKGIEIASAGELELALACGCRPENILIAGPGKSEHDLRRSLGSGIGEIHIESLTEAARIQKLAEELDCSANVCLRVNASADVAGGAMRMGGRPTPFGIDEEQLPSHTEALKQFARLELQGIHLYTGTQILDADVLLRQYQRGIEIAAEVAQQANRPLRSIDFGGGLGVPYFPNEEELELAKLAAGLEKLVDQVRGNPLLKDARLIIEPGRYLTADAGLYAAKVLDIKQSRGKKFVVVDGGFHHHQAAAGNLGQTIKRNFPIAVLNRLSDAGPLEAVDIVGPLCTPLDTLARQVLLPKIEIGDLIGVFRSGAYGRSASPLGFLSHSPPVEIYLQSGQASGRRVCQQGVEVEAEY